MLRIRRSRNADTRSASKEVTKEELMTNSKMHIADVKKAIKWMCDELKDIGTWHDYTKIDNFREFYDNFKCIQQGDLQKFKEMNWYQNFHLNERHHLPDRCPEDVNLFDVLERVADIVMAGMARSGKIYDDTLDAEILVKAYKNTIELLKKQIKVEG